MKKVYLIARADIIRHRGAFISLFIIIVIVSILTTAGLSVLLGINRNFEDVVMRTNGLHSMFLMTKDLYNPSFEDIIKNDSRVSQYEISEVLSPSSVLIDYGGETELRAVIFDLEKPVDISSPKITEEDISIPRDQAIYLPFYAKELDYKIGDDFTMTYKNKPIRLTVTGFFETNELSITNTMLALKFLVPNVCFEMLKQRFDTCEWIAVRFFDSTDSPHFNLDFISQTNIEITDFSLTCDTDLSKTAAIMPAAVFSGLIILFALLTALISLFVIRSRVMNSIEDTMHEIGVLKASGYTSAQIIACYIMEYALISLPAALLGIVFSIPAFPAVRHAFISTSGFLWSFDIDIMAGLAAAIVIVAVLLMMVLRSCHKIKKLPPASALLGGIAVNSFRRNHFPLRKGAGSVHTRLGLKNTFVFMKTYIMTGIIIAALSFASVFVTVLFQNLVIDQEAFARMAGFELADVSLSVTRHTDADILAAELEKMPEVRKTSMHDQLSIQVNGIETLGLVSYDFDKSENMFTHDGRFPRYDNEVAIPKLFADLLGKEIGDSVMIKASGVSQEYIITGFFSVLSNFGRVATLTLDGYQRLDPNYKRSSINVYLDGDVTFSEFRQKLEQNTGVLNVYKHDENSAFAGPKVVAEEKISNYLEQYDVDSVEYAVIYNGDIILSGSSGEYQIEKIINMREFAKSQLGSYAGMVSLMAQLIMVLSLIIITITLSLTVRSIVTRRHRELGTLKALGFTTRQLARQLAISFMPCAVIGIVFGCTAGAFTASPALTAVLSTTGAYGAVFAVNPLIVFLVGMLFLIAAFTVANLSAGSIRNISAYELIADRPVAGKNRSRFAVKKHALKRLASFLAAILLCFSLSANHGYAVSTLSAVSDINSLTASSSHELYASYKLSAVTDENSLTASSSHKLYGIGSVSKVFTAASVMKLVDEGKINLDTSLTAYIPEFAMADERYAQITPRMLLNHSCGFMGSTDHNVWLLGDNDTSSHEHFLELLKTQTLKHDPGERSIYCNDGFTLAEILVEYVSGVSFTEFIERNFSAPLGLESIKTPQSDFDRNRLAAIYIGNIELLPENLGDIGSGGMYATMDDLCRFATIFMDSADGTVLSRNSVDEMAKKQHRKEMIPPDADTVLRYGLGWDSVETYPFSTYGIKALSKGGSTGRYHTNLTVLPEYNLAVAIAASGVDDMEQIIAQEIALSVLESLSQSTATEGGSVPDDAGAILSSQNLERAAIPESYKAYAGIYDAGPWDRWEIKFTEDTLIITPIMVRNERAQVYIYNTDGVFVSTNGDYIGMYSSKEGSRGVSFLSFAEEKYLVVSTYENLPGLGTTAFAMPFAEKLESSVISNDVAKVWEARNSKEYLLVSEKYSSMQYLRPVAKTLTDNRAYGYVGMGIYKGGGQLINMAKILDETTALGFQRIPTMTGRDTNNFYITVQNGVEYLKINNCTFIDAASAKSFFELGDAIVLKDESVWVDIGSEAGGKILNIGTPQNGAWFAYDDKMNCIATSLEKFPRNIIVLPETGRLMFAGEVDAEFLLR